MKYIVCSPSNGALGLGDENILWAASTTRHNPATIFSTRLAAKRAIVRTYKFAKEHGHDECRAWQNFYIVLAQESNT